MNLEDVLESLSRLNASYINYVDGIESLQDIKLTEELPSAYIIYLQSRKYYLLNNIKRAKFFYQLNHVLHSSSIPYEASIGKNSVFAYGGIGCIVHSAARVGARCVIGSNVTIGGAPNGIPVIGEDVYISTGAKIIGGVAIGDGAVIGANAVVLKNVPPFSVVGGIPAKVINQITASNFKNYSGFYWCKNNDESCQKFCDWYIKKGKLSDN